MQAYVKAHGAKQLRKLRSRSPSCRPKIISPISDSHLLFGVSEHQYLLSFFSPLPRSPCPSLAYTSINDPLSPPLLSQHANVEQKECIQVRALGVWSYSAEISHWRKVNMVGVMRLALD